MVITLSGNAHPSYLKGADGTRYTLSSSTLLYTANEPHGKPYIEGYTALRPGTQLNLFTRSGKIIAIYAAGSADSTQGAVIVSGKADASDFARLTGGASGYSISKNGQNIPMKDIQPYDVVTYDAVNNMLLVSDLRISATFADAVPNAQAPQTITAIGTQFEVLDSAWDNMDKVNIGDTVTLLLTADGKVAGIKKPAHAIRATAIGLASESGVDIFLPNGNTLAVRGGFSGNTSPAGKVVLVTGCDAKGRINASPITSQRIPGSFDPDAMLLGDKTVCTGVRVFDQVRNHITVPVEFGALGIIPADKIKAYHTNTSGQVDCIVLNNFTGNAYSYGLCTVETDEDGEQYLSFENGVDAGFSGLKTALSVEDRQFSGVAIGSDGNPKSVIELKRLKAVSPADFFESQGSIYLEHDGENYLVSDDVVCYKQANRLWFTNETGAARLAACKAFSEKLSAYYDPFSQQIRVVTAE